MKHSPFPGVSLLLPLLFSVQIVGCRSEGATAGDPTTARLGESLSVWSPEPLTEPLWTVGALEGEDFEILGEVTSAAFVGGMLAVADGQAGRMHWFDREGTHKISAGGPGAGPGEFARLASLAVLPDSTIAAQDAGRSRIQFFTKGGEYTREVTFAGILEQMCAVDSTLVLMGAAPIGTGIESPLHLLDLKADGTWASIGPPSTPDPNMPELVGSEPWVVMELSQRGVIGCLDGVIFYARSIDGTVMALDTDGTRRWETRIPSFTPMEIGKNDIGVYFRPPFEAPEVNFFAGVKPWGSALAVQIYRAQPRDMLARTVTTIALDPGDGTILGMNDSIPQILAVEGGRAALLTESIYPEVAVYSIDVPSDR